MIRVMRTAPSSSGQGIISQRLWSDRISGSGPEDSGSNPLGAMPRW